MPNELNKDVLTAEARELFDVLNIIVSEFDSDPMSVQCFDLRIVQRAKDVVSKIKAA